MTVLKCISMVIVSKNPVKCTEHGITKVQAVRQSGGTKYLALNINLLNSDKIHPNILQQTIMQGARGQKEWTGGVLHIQLEDIPC